MNIEHLMRKIGYDLEKLRVAYLRAGEIDGVFLTSKEESYDLFLQILRHHKDEIIMSIEKIEDDLAGKK